MGKKAEVILSKLLTGYWPYVLLCGLGLILYAKAIFFNFVFLDDNTLLLDNAVFLSKFSNVIEAFKQDIFHNLYSTSAFYRPILMVTFLWDAIWAGVKP